MFSTRMVCSLFKHVQVVVITCTVIYLTLFVFTQHSRNKSVSIVKDGIPGLRNPNGLKSIRTGSINLISDKINDQNASKLETDNSQRHDLEDMKEEENTNKQVEQKTREENKDKEIELKALEEKRPQNQTANRTKESNGKEGFDSIHRELTDHEIQHEGPTTFYQSRDVLENSPYIYRPDDLKYRINPRIKDKLEVKRISTFMPWMKDRGHLDGCAFKCVRTYNMTEADGVWFEATVTLVHPVPHMKRPRNQIWVIQNMDPLSQETNLNNDYFRSAFNWTSTYKRDSDMPMNFGMLKKRTLGDLDYEKIHRGKSKGSAWFVSNCHSTSRREEYVKRMQTVSPVDIYGNCGTHKCGVVHPHRDVYDRLLCFPILTDNYKFYLAFESDFCKEYVTEKFFKMFTDVQVIPVVRGAVRYKELMPNGTFVDAADFETPEALMRYLVELGNNPVQYIAMLKEKNRWEMIKDNPVECQMCERLHTDTREGYYYHNIDRTFRGDPRDCRKPTDLDKKDNQTGSQ